MSPEGAGGFPPERVRREQEVSRPKESGGSRRFPTRKSPEGAGGFPPERVRREQGVLTP